MPTKCDGKLTCLSKPTDCLPGYAPDGPVFLDDSLATATVKSGYTREMIVPSPMPAAEAAQKKVSPSSVACYAYLMRPADASARTFWGDCSGRLCWLPAGQAPPKSADLWEKPCTALQ